ncbi:MAG: hypothetical protein HXX15_13180 [Rhodopseudomonas sp.]|uniref:hypothetical protein n=1 Tax=Rhodopseudomonas sp. TaxID=1078 RepID=UPI00178F2EB9|nr:hypothetical protein [Rhodopseudomonas sp.]NVN87027.1 hypothetical protein [Rhodopseudomonas sp.]
MIDQQAAWLAHQRQRWMRPDAQRFMRPDAARWIRPDVARFLRPGTNPADVFPALDRKYNPNQPRVPAGHLGAGEWTDGGGGDRRNRDAGGYDARLASSDKPPLGRASVLGIMARAAARLIEAYRSENGLRDLFGRNEGTVAFTQIDGHDIFGSNSSSPTYTSTDRRDAETMRDRLIAKYPDDMETELVGRMPNDALFHAESNVLMRASREFGGTLQGRDMVVVVDRPMCNIAVPCCR